MKLTSAITTLLFAASASVVAAEPSKTETAPRVSYTDKGADANAAPNGWIELASPTPAKHGRQYITVDEDAGPFTLLRLDAAAGRPMVKAVRVLHTDGSGRLIRVEKRLDPKRPAYVELRGARAIEHVVVITDGRSGSYTLHGAPQHAVATR